MATEGPPSGAHANTTVQAAESVRDLGASCRLALQWLHPRRRLTEIGDMELVLGRGLGCGFRLEGTARRAI
jgi:hypothetical protein